MWMKANSSPKINCNQCENAETRNARPSIRPRYWIFILRCIRFTVVLFNFFIVFTFCCCCFSFGLFNFWLARLLRQSHVRRSKQNHLQQLGIGALSECLWEGFHCRSWYSIPMTLNTWKTTFFCPVWFENVRHANIC